MATKYNRKVLSDQLADLGAKIGHPPMPWDLEKGMGDERTFFRWFDDDWYLALEYAGFTAEDIAKVEIPANRAAAFAKIKARSKTWPTTLDEPSPPNVPDPAPTPAPEATIDPAMPTDSPAPPLGATPPESMAEPAPTPPPASSSKERKLGYVSRLAPRPPGWRQDNAKLINLFNPHLYLATAGGETIKLNIPFQGIASVTLYPRRRAFAERALADYLSGARVLLSDYPKSLTVLQPNGRIASFPEYQVGVYYLVSAAVAQAARDLDRETYDLLYPTSVTNRGRDRIVRGFEMINTPDTWWIET